MWPFSKEKENPRIIELMRCNSFLADENEKLQKRFLLLQADAKIMMQNLLVYNEYVKSHSQIIQDFVKATEMLPNDMTKVNEIIEKYQ